MFVALFTVVGFSTRPDLTSSPACTIKQCQYLGTGYNLIVGDPTADGADPGWRNDIFTNEWITSSTPRNTAVNVIRDCSYTATTSDISGGRSAQTSLSRELAFSASAGFGGVGLMGNVAFTASNSLTSMNQSIWDESKHFEEARASCKLFYAEIQSDVSKAGGFRAPFEAAVRALPNASDDQSADELLENFLVSYGTHYSSGVTKGGQVVVRYEMTQSSYESYQEDSMKNGYGISAGVQGTFYSAQADASIEINEDATSAFKDAIETASTTESVRGGLGFVKGDLQRWAEELEENYAAVSGTKSRLEPITELLTPDNFPGLDPGVQITAEAFVQRLCTAGGSNLGYEMCTPFAVDPLMFTQNTRAGITSVAWARDGGNVTTGDTNGFVQTWDVLTRSPWLTKFGPTSAVASVAYSPDGRYLAVGFKSPAADPTSSQSVRVFDTATGEVTLTLGGAGGSVAYSPDGKQLASVNSPSDEYDHFAQIWDMVVYIPTLTELKLGTPFDGQQETSLNSVTFSPDGAHLAVAANLVNFGTPCIAIFTTETNQPAEPSFRCLGPLPLASTGIVYSVSYSPTGSYLASGSADGTAQIYNTATGERTRTLTHQIGANSAVYSVAYSPDGKHLASGGADGTVKIWKVLTGELTRILFHKKGAVNSVAYSPDGNFLASGRTISPDSGEYGSLTIEPV